MLGGFEDPHKYTEKSMKWAHKFMPNMLFCGPVAACLWPLYGTPDVRMVRGTERFMDSFINCPNGRWLLGGAAPGFSPTLFIRVHKN